MWLPGYRLITTGLHADIVEWDLDTLQPARNSGVYGSAIWGMALHPTRNLLATVCQDGRVRVYDSDTLDFRFSFGISDTVENRNSECSSFHFPPFPVVAFTVVCFPCVESDTDTAQ